jgi:hypothetical protein
MTKEEYIQLKKADPMAVMYEFYKERFDSKRHKVMLSRTEFNVYAPIYMDLDRAYANAISHYDSKFNVTELRDTKGNIIKIY